MNRLLAVGLAFCQSAGSLCQGHWRLARLRHSCLPSRVKVLIAAAIYILVYIAMYILFVEPIYDYFGLGLREDLSVFEGVFLVILAWLPSFLLPLRLRKPSDFLVSLQYLLIYVPAVWVAFNASLPRLEKAIAWQLIAVMLVAIVLQLAANRWLRILPLRIHRLQRPLFISFLLVICLLGLGYVAVLLGHNFQLVSLERIYDLRNESAQTLVDAGSAIAGYIFNWLTGAILPFVMALALMRRSWLLGAIAVAGYIFLYGVWGSKATLLAPMAIMAFFWLFRDSRRLLPRQLIGGFCVMLLLPIILTTMDKQARDFPMGWLISLVHQRTFSSSALLITQYFSFFQTHSHTHGSHIGLVGLFVNYPFDQGVPTTVGLSMYGSPVTANVNYWAQDGISSFGLWGIVSIAVLASFVFWVLDCVAYGLDPRFTTLCVAFAAMNLSDTSLFTTLLTGGMGIIMMSFAFSPRSLAPDIHIDKTS